MCRRDPLVVWGRALSRRRDRSAATGVGFQQNPGLAVCDCLYDRTLDGADGIWFDVKPAFDVSKVKTALVATSDGSGKPPLEPVRYGNLLRILYRFDAPTGDLETVTFQVYSSCPAGHKGAGLYLLDADGLWGDRVAWAGCKTGWHSVIGPADDLVVYSPETDEYFLDGMVILTGWNLDGIRISKARIVWTYAP